jgi:hypothetical protein
MDRAMVDAKRSAGGILAFAAISGLFDLLASYANERKDIVGKIITRVIYAVWTTATYVIMPAMVIEGLSFGAAFKRSKDLTKQDPTEVGTGVIGIALANWVLGAVCFGIAYYGQTALAHIHPIVGAVFFFIFFNLYWTVSGYIKIAYFTCFYLWAKECADKKSSATSLAPAPLAAALAA